MNQTRWVRIRRRYAVWMEDTVIAPLPAGVDPSDTRAVEEWAVGSYDDLHEDAWEARENGDPYSSDSEIECEDQFVDAVEAHDDEYQVEVIEPSPLFRFAS